MGKTLVPTNSLKGSKIGPAPIPPTSFKILLIEDSPTAARIVFSLFEEASEPYYITHETTLEAGIRRAN